MADDANVSLSQHGLRLSYHRFLSDSAPGFAAVALLFGYGSLLAGWAQRLVDLPTGAIVVAGVLIFVLATPLGLAINALSWFCLGWLAFRLEQFCFQAHRAACSGTGGPPGSSGPSRQSRAVHRLRPLPGRLDRLLRYGLQPTADTLCFRLTQRYFRLTSYRRYLTRTAALGHVLQTARPDRYNEAVGFVSGAEVMFRGMSLVFLGGVGIVGALACLFGGEGFFGRFVGFGASLILGVFLGAVFLFLSSFTSFYTNLRLLSECLALSVTARASQRGSHDDHGWRRIVADLSGPTGGVSGAAAGDAGQAGTGARDGRRADAVTGQAPPPDVSHMGKRSYDSDAGSEGT